MTRPVALNGERRAAKVGSEHDVIMVNEVLGRSDDGATSERLYHYDSSIIDCAYLHLFLPLVTTIPMI